MILVIDVGNTNFTLGVFEGKRLLATFRMTTKMPRTSDEYGITICEMLEHRGVSAKVIEAVVIASVVPDLMHSLASAIIKYLDCRPIIVGPGIKTGIKVATDNPKETGADRIVDALAAYELYGGPIIVMDFGTATTYDLVNAEGAFIAGVTAPGLRTSARALWGEAAKLPEIEIKKPDTIMAKETVTSMQAGLIYGQIGQTEYIIKELKAASGIEGIRTVATGGLGKIIADATDYIDYYDPELTLKGLQLIYDKNRGK